MKSPDNERLLPRIDQKLARFVKSSGIPPVWVKAWSGLGAHSTDEERLRVCQAIRDAASFSEDKGYFLVCWAAEYLADKETARLPDPLLTLNIYESIKTCTRVLADVLARYGEGKMANLCRTNQEEHDRRREVGRLFFFGPIEDEEAGDATWLNDLLRLLATRIIASKPVESLAYRYQSSDLQVGIAAPGWAIDIESLREVFDKIDSCGWYAACERPYLWLEGAFDGREVYLRILSDTAQEKGWEIWKKP
jgi:hypothetical protein